MVKKKKKYARTPYVLLSVIVSCKHIGRKITIIRLLTRLVGGSPKLPLSIIPLLTTLR